jgi:arylsulfatase A-like enzyme
MPVSSVAMAGDRESVDRPNVLFIAVDDLNVWVGALGGHPQVRTPNIDRLAARGTLFTRAYCAAPACNPSRAALLSGRRPSTTGIYHNNQPWKPVLRDSITLPEHFKGHGYYVAGGGKIFHGGDDDPRFWHEYFRRPADPPPARPSLSGLGRAQFDWGPLDATDEAMGDYKLVSWAAKQLEQSRDRPLFLAVGFVKPHLPWYVPSKYFDMYPLDAVKLPAVRDDDLADVPPAGVRMAAPDGDHRAVVAADQWRQAVQAYLATISFLDAQVGRLLDSLDRSPHHDHTIVVLWGDHGWHLGEKQHWRKFALWEEATRAPLIFVAPGLGKPGARCDRAIDYMNVGPTLTDLCDLPHLAAAEGASLRRLLADPTASWDRPAITTHGRNHHAVRTDRWRYIRYSSGDEELYDHNADPHEWSNLAADPRHAAIKAELAARLPKDNAADAPRATGDGERPKAKRSKAKKASPRADD